MTYLTGDAAEDVKDFPSIDLTREGSAISAKISGDVTLNVVVDENRTSTARQILAILQRDTGMTFHGHYFKYGGMPITVDHVIAP